MGRSVCDVAAGMNAPGMDSREWVHLATLDKDGATYDTEGIFLDLTLLLDDHPVRAQLVRNRTHEPLHDGDLFAVVFPDGSPDGRAMCFGPIANHQDQVPSEIRNDPSSFWIAAPKNTNIRMRLTGSGKVQIDAPAANIELGPDTSTNPVACWDELKLMMNQIKTMLSDGLSMTAGGNPVVTTPHGDAIIGFIEAGLNDDHPASRYAVTRSKKQAP